MLVSKASARELIRACASSEPRAALASNSNHPHDIADHPQIIAGPPWDTVEKQPVDTSEIVVTATRRNEALSDVPLAVCAVTAETLENSRRQRHSPADPGQSPSLLVSSTSSEAGAGVARIRGIGTVGDNPGLESSVAVFIDGVYRSRTGVGLTELGAIDRIEVLRGPQGTLFGRNASAGLISIITAKPQFNTEVDGELDDRQLRSAPRSKLGATGAAHRHDRRAPRRRVDEARRLPRGRHLRPRRQRPRPLDAARPVAVPADRATCRSASSATMPSATRNAARRPICRRTTITAAGRAAVDHRGRSSAALGAVINDDTFERDVSITPGRSYRSDVKDYGLSGEVVYDFGGAELTSITAYRYNKYIRGQDADFNNLDILLPRRRRRRRSTASRPSPRNCACRARRSAAGSTGWSAAITPTRSCGSTTTSPTATIIERFANCLVAANSRPAADVSTPTSPTCFNRPPSPARRRSSRLASRSFNGSRRSAALANPALRRSHRRRCRRSCARSPSATPACAGRPGVGQSPIRHDRLRLDRQRARRSGSTFNGVRLDDTYNQTSNNLALFTHNIFAITDQLKLTVGARYTHERKKLEADLTRQQRALPRVFAGSSRALALPAALPCVAHRQRVPGGIFIGSTTRRPKASSRARSVLSYKPTDELLTYASYSRGYKAAASTSTASALPRQQLPASDGAGAAATASLDDLQFKPEINDAFELGAKYNGRGFDVNVALFHQLFTTSSSTRSTASISSSRTSTAARTTSTAPTTTIAPSPAPAPARPGPASAAGHRGRSLHPADARRQLQPRRRLMPTPAIATIWSAPTGEPLTDALVPAAGPPLVQLRRRSTATGVGHLDAADRRHRHARPVLCRRPAHEPVQHRLRPRHREDPERLHRGQRAASACTGRTTAGRSSCGRRTCSTRIIMQVAFDAPLQGSGTHARRSSSGFYHPLDPAVRRLPWRAADLRR